MRKLECGVSLLFVYIATSFKRSCDCFNKSGNIM